MKHDFNGNKGPYMYEFIVKFHPSLPIGWRFVDRVELIFICFISDENKRYPFHSYRFVFFSVRSDLCSNGTKYNIFDADAISTNQKKRNICDGTFGSFLDYRSA